jgi:hypothetical protein
LAFVHFGVYCDKEVVSDILLRFRAASVFMLIFFN